MSDLKLSQKVQRSELMGKVDKPYPWGGSLLLTCIFIIVVPILYKVNWMTSESMGRLSQFLCFAICAIGIDLIWGFSGILSLCQALFFCIGGYAIGMHMALHSQVDANGVPSVLSIVSSQVGGMELPGFWKPFRGLWMSIFLAMVLPGLLAFLFGYFTFRSRVRGVYFSIITQATVLAFCLVFRRNETMLCGTNGLNAFHTLGSWDLRLESTQAKLYFVTAVVLLLSYAGAQYLIRSRVGRLMVAVRDNESRLRFAGFQPVTVKTFVFVISALLSAVAGMLYVPQKQIITPSILEPVVSINMVLWVALGGRGTLMGPIIGALIVNYAENILTTQMPKSWLFIQGMMYILVVMLFPDGVMGAWKTLRRGREISMRAKVELFLQVGGTVSAVLGVLGVVLAWRMHSRGMGAASVGAMGLAAAGGIIAGAFYLALQKRAADKNVPGVAGNVATGQGLLCVGMAVMLLAGKDWAYGVLPLALCVVGFGVAYQCLGLKNYGEYTSAVDDEAGMESGSLVGKTYEAQA